MPGTGLGLLRYDRPSAGKGLVLTPAASRAARDSTILIITKANSRATVHRDVYLDYISVKRFDARGECVGEQRFLGLYASAAYNDTIHDIPLLDVRAQEVLRLTGLSADSHSGKDILQILETYPRDELFQTRLRAGGEIATSVLHLQERRKTKALPAPRRVRPLRLVPRLPPARPLQHDGPPAHRGDPARGLRRREHRQHDPRQRVDARAPPLRGAHANGHRHPRHRRGRPREARHRRDPHVGRGPLRGARPGAWPRRGGTDDGGVRQGPARGVQGGLRRRDGGRGPRPDRRARRRRPHDRPAPLRRPGLRRPARAALQGSTAAPTCP